MRDVLVLSNSAIYFNSSDPILLFDKSNCLISLFFIDCNSFLKVAKLPIYFNDHITDYYQMNRIIIRENILKYNDLIYSCCYNTTYNVRCNFIE